MKHRSSWWKTLIGIILTLIMLFPVYWMINISFTQRRSIRSGDLFPKDFTLDNYASALSSQLPYLGTSLLVAIGCVILTLAIALPSSYDHCFLGVQRLKVHELPVDCCSDDSRGRYVSSFYQSTMTSVFSTVFRDLSLPTPLCRYRSQ